MLVLKEESNQIQKVHNVHKSIKNHSFQFLAHSVDASLIPRIRTAGRIRVIGNKVSEIPNLPEAFHHFQS